MTTPDSELKKVERTSLELADLRLRVAVAEYVRVTDGISDRAQIERVQVDIEAAEDELWQLRSSLLNCSRPPWVPSASLIADWFSVEDRVYDEVEPRRSW